METATWKWDESFLPAKWVVATYDSTLGIYTVKPAAPPPNNQIEPWVDSSQKHFAVWVLFESERDGMLLNHLYLYLYIWICKYCSLNKHGQTKTMLSSDIKGCLKTNIHGIHHHLRRITTFDKCLLSRGKKNKSKVNEGTFPLSSSPIPLNHGLIRSGTSTETNGRATTRRMGHTGPGKPSSNAGLMMKETWFQWTKHLPRTFRMMCFVVMMIQTKK